MLTALSIERGRRQRDPKPGERLFHYHQENRLQWPTQVNPPQFFPFICTPSSKGGTLRKIIHESSGIHKVIKCCIAISVNAKLMYMSHITFPSQKTLPYYYKDTRESPILIKRIRENQHISK